MTTREDLNNVLKAEFDKVQGLTKEHKSKMAENARKLFELRKTKVPVDTKFVDTEFSRYKITRLKDNTIIINELKEDQAKSLFDRICQLT